MMNQTAGSRPWRVSGRKGRPAPKGLDEVEDAEDSRELPFAVENQDGTVPGLHDRAGGKAHLERLLELLDPLLDRAVHVYARVALQRNHDLAGLFLFFPNALPGPGIGIVDFGGQKIDVAGFAEVAESAGFERFLRRVKTAVACQHDHRNIGMDFLDFRQGLVAVHAGHLDIEDHHILGILLEHLNGFLPAPGHRRLVAFSRENLRRGRPELLLVIHHEHPDFACHDLYLPSLGTLSGEQG